MTGREARALDESDVDLDISLPPLTRPARKVRVTPKHCDGTCTGHGGPRADYADWWQEHTDDDGELLASLPEPVATLAAHVMALQARIDKLADPTAVELDPRGWDTRCACAYDHPDAVCAVHDAALVADPVHEGRRRRTCPRHGVVL